MLDATRAAASLSLTTKELTTMEPVTNSDHLQIGGILFPDLDQLDFTGPFEILSRIPNSTFHILAKDRTPISDVRGLILSPTLTFSEAPPLDLLLVPGGSGVNALMEDETVLAFVRHQAAAAKYTMSVCTGALVLGAAGLLKGRRATTHWASHHLLKHFGAIPVNERVVLDRGVVTTAGVTAGIDGALRMAALLRGDQAAQEIQLFLQYAPDPPFESGTPETALPDVLQASRETLRDVLEARVAIVSRVEKKLAAKSAA